MPKATYFNLNEEKKARLMQAAQHEFSRAPLEDVSVSAIVKDAEIPRGSFYQYFENKEDLYYYFLGNIVTDIEQHFFDMLKKTHGDLFAAMTLFFNFAVEEITEGPNADIFKNVGTNDFQHGQNSKHFGKNHHKHPFFKAVLAIEDKIATSVDRTKLRIENDEELKNLQQLLFTVFAHTIGHYFRSQKEDSPETIANAKAEFATTLDWIANGALKSKKELG
ncbi:regulatory protein, TetR [Pediococcus damnosus]|uniref:Regulatory protein, TetR n=2 Tax=Pediococcus damnosus TaxID=51663 RepID=A0ABN4NAL0_9LACO|nr:TetR family transcriptional regulator [Pediococcus damnosus]AMV59937.1 regulatory protein, TetR [Pediococcus damnosus]AMV64181.1 regulatory protein, TetR [Pediococcus damnosus]AMV67645.1 regulatory protein, TetR [Pediococcus damnosus]AMV69026.1 regulatory protein, TetR [Pediococcus damnosus]KJU74972.1 TetR family transcriptional regulator [Pediococcus damnosus LMG 28219]